jgi:hypothetical protein
MIGTVILFAGHRVDEPGRTPPRFPPECERKARLAIRSILESIAAAAKGPVLGIAGAADGGDILFHEVCAELYIESEVCLALPAAEFIHTSVQISWAERFRRLLETHPTVTLAPASGNVWLRDHEWQLRRARELHPHRTVLIALLEEGEKDIPGGTSGMVRMVRESGMEVIHLDTRRICA